MKILIFYAHEVSKFELRSMIYGDKTLTYINSVLNFKLYFKNCASSELIYFLAVKRTKRLKGFGLYKAHRPKL